MGQSLADKFNSRKTLFFVPHFFLPPISEDKMNYQAKSGAVWLLLSALAIIRAANAVEETVVVESWNKGKDLCAAAEAKQHFVIRCEVRCTCSGNKSSAYGYTPYCPQLSPPRGKSNCKLVKKENECCKQWVCNENPSAARKLVKKSEMLTRK